MKLRSVVKGLVEIAALALLVIPASMAQEGTGAADGSSKARELTQVPAMRPGTRPEVKGSQRASKAAKGTQAQLAATGTQLSLLAPITGQPVAYLRQIDGSILVSTQSGLVAGDPALPLKVGTRVIATANSQVIVAYVDGCEVRLDPNQRLEIRLPLPCSERALDVKSILVETGVAGGMAALGSSGGLTSAALGGGLQATSALGGLAGTVAVVRERTGDTVSPN